MEKHEWSSKEVARLRKMVSAKNKKSIKQMAEALNRSEPSVRAKIRRVASE